MTVPPQASSESDIFPSALIRALETLLEVTDLQIRCDRRWAAQASTDHRLQIRRALALELQSLADSRLGIGDTASGLIPVDAAPSKNPFGEAGPVKPTPDHDAAGAFNDLRTLPERPGWSASISHGAHLGGFALCRASSSSENLGFDIEELARLRPALVKRVSSPAELEKAPDIRWLWGAKEAAFKALRGRSQPSTITEIEVHDWSHQSLATGINLHLFRASALNQVQGIGAMVLPLNAEDGEIFALFSRKVRDRST